MTADLQLTFLLVRCNEKSRERGGESKKQYTGTAHHHRTNLISKCIKKRIKRTKIRQREAIFARRKKEEQERRAP